MKFLRNIFTYILIVLSVSCASSQEKYEDVFRVSPRYQGIHEEFKPYVDSFMFRSDGSVTEHDLQGLTMGFRNYRPNDTAVGTCWLTPWFREIDISKKWWDENQSQFRREELLFHELGHCVLYRPHTKPTSSDSTFGWLERLAFKMGIFKEFNGFLEDGCPSSYMHPYTASEECITKHYQYYNEELFNFKDEVVEERTDIIIFENKHAN